MAKKILIKKVSSQNEMDKCLQIRKSVFVIGQKVPLDLEIDGKDQISEHYLLLVDDAPCGVARIRYMDDYAKIERVGVLETYHGRGLGKILMKQILADLEKHPTVKKIKLSSQVQAIPFYEKLGFQICSEEYMDADIPHKDMVLNNIGYG